MLPTERQEAVAVSPSKRLKELETENARLKKLLAESHLEIEVTVSCCEKSGERTGRREVVRRP